MEQGGVSNIPTYSGAAGTAPTQTTAGTPGDFAGAASTNPLLAVQTQLRGMTPAQFFAAYDVTSTQQPLYLSSTGTLNDNAVYLAYYKGLSQQERQSIQQQMVDVGALSASDANGLDNSSATSAFEGLIGQTAAQGTNVIQYLAKNATGTAGIGNQISADLTKAQENATQPIVATVENPTTLSADITAAFETALGYSPDQAQIQSFISQVQGQDTAYAEAPRTEAQQQIDLAHSEESELNKLGPDGIDTVIQAYQAAVSGTKLPGAGTPQGPVNGQVATGEPNQFPTAGTQMPAGTAARITPQGTEVGMNTAPISTTRNEPVPEGGIGGFFDNLANKIWQGGAFGGSGGAAVVPGKVTTTRARPGGIAPALPAGSGTTPTYGGTYALSAADWKKAQSDYAPAKKYATPGSAPQSVQLGAFSAILQSAYDSTGSWSKAVSEIASGSPFGSAEGTHLSAFGDQVASEVNNQITQLQSQVNNDTVTTKVSAPDATAEADLAAKQSDPTGYYAAQDASWGSVLNKMLSGTPDMYNQTSSDTFTGPVASEAATQPAMASAGAV